MNLTSPNIDSRDLRAQGRLRGYRPLEPLKQTDLYISLPNINTAPKGPVDVMTIMGLGPVEPILVNTHKGRKVNISKSRMKHNTLAALELAANGYIKKDGLIIPSGTATADPEQVNEAVKYRFDLINELKNDEKAKHFKKYQIKSALKAPATLDETEMVFKTTEAELMTNYFNKARTKSGLTAKKIGIEIFVENQATETIDNFIYSLNDLDRRSQIKENKIFSGSIIFITSGYHIARSYVIAQLLGISNIVVPLISQEVLNFFGYSEKNSLFDKESEEYDRNTRWDEQKWIRMLYQHPRYLLPKLVEVEDDQRLLTILLNLEKVYGKQALERFNLGLLEIEKIKFIRLILSSFQRTNPVDEDWLKNETEAVDQAIEVHKKFTSEWLSKYKAKHPLIDLTGFFQDLKIKF